MRVANAEGHAHVDLSLEFTTRIDFHQNDPISFLLSNFATEMNIGTISHPIQYDGKWH